MPAFAPKVVTVGTSVVTALEKNNRRIQYLIKFPSSSAIAGNTGIVYVGVGIVPNATAGNSAQQHIMINGDSFSETTIFTDPKLAGSDVSQDPIFVIASTSGQTIEVFEFINTAQS